MKHLCGRFRPSGKLSKELSTHSEVRKCGLLIWFHFPDKALAILELIKTFSGDHELIFIGDHNPRKPMSENTVNKSLRVMGYDTQVEVCGHSFRRMVCSSLIESGLWSRDAVERQMSHMELNSVRAAYLHKAEHLDERRLMLQWWADFLDANRERRLRRLTMQK